MSDRIGIKFEVDDNGSVVIKNIEELSVRAAGRVNAAWERVLNSQDRLNQKMGTAGTTIKSAADSYIKLGKNANAAEREFNNIDKTTYGLMGSLKRFRWEVFTVIALFYMVKRATETITEEFINYDKALTSVTFALAKNNELTDVAISKSKELANKIGNQTGMLDSQILSIQGMLSAYGVEQSQIERTTKAVVDLYIWRTKIQGQAVSMQTAAELLGKAYVGVTPQLRRYGIVIKETHSAAETFEKVLQQIERRFGSVSDVYGKTFDGVFEKLKRQFTEIGTMISGVLISLLTYVGESIVGVFGILTHILSALTKVMNEAFDSSAVKNFTDKLDAFSDKTLEIIGTLEDLRNVADDNTKGIINDVDAISMRVLEIANNMDKFKTSSQKSLTEILSLFSMLGLKTESIANILDQEFIFSLKITDVTDGFRKISEQLNKLGIDHGALIEKVSHDLMDLYIKHRSELAKNAKNALDFIVENEVDRVGIMEWANEKIYEVDSYILKMRYLEYKEYVEKSILSEEDKIEAIFRLNDAMNRELERVRVKTLGTPFEQFMQGMDDASIKWGTVSDQMIEAGNNVASSIKNGIGEALFDIMKGTKSVKDAFLDMANSILDALQKVIAEMIAVNLIQQVIGHAIGSFSTSPVTPSPATSTGPVPASTGTAIANKGAIWPGFIPMYDGYVATKPTFGLIADTPASTPEIVTPENLMRKVVREESENRSSNVVINIENRSRTPVSARESGRKFDGKKYIVNVVLEDFNSNGPLKNAIQGIK